MDAVFWYSWCSSVLFGVVVVVFVGIQDFFLTDIKHEYVSRNLSEHQKTVRCVIGACLVNTGFFLLMVLLLLLFV